MAATPAAGSAEGLASDAGRFPWLPVSVALGRTAAAFLIASNFAFLIAPLVYLLNLLLSPDPGNVVDPSDPTAVALLLASDPRRIFAVGDVLVLVGASLLATAVILVLVSLPRGRVRIPRDAFLFGGATVAAIVAWAVATVYAVSQSRGISGVGGVAATGGWGAAAAGLLAASLLYAGLAVRVDRAMGWRRRLSSMAWPVFAVVNLVGSAALASAFRGAGDEVLIVGLALQVVPIPLLGVVAYADLRARFASWSALGAPPLEEEPGEASPPTGQLVGVALAAPESADGVAMPDETQEPPPPPEPPPPDA